MHLRIAHKMFAGYLLYLAVALTFGWFVHGKIEQITIKEQVVEFADDCKEELLELRRNEKNYILRREATYLDRIREITEGLKSQLATAKERNIQLFYRTEYAALLDALRTYTALLENFRQLYQHQTALIAEQRQLGRSLEQAAGQQGLLWLTDEILELRLLEKNYLLFAEEKYYAKLRARAATLQEKLGGSSAIGASLVGYRRTASQLAAVRQEEALHLPRIRGAAIDMEQIIDGMRQRERDDIRDYLVNSQRMLVMALVILALGGSMLTWFLARAIASPLRHFEQTVRQIAHGDFDLRVEAEGDLETRSLQRAFNAMLDNLAQSHDSLEQALHLLQEKGVQLVEAEKLASIGLLASGVAHEINNPLANISLTAETLRDDGQLSAAEQQELFSDIIQQTERVSAVVDNLLGYARSLKNNSMAVVDLRGLASQSLGLVANQLRLQDITVQQELPQKAVLVEGNRGKLVQVFVNLLMNAIQAMESGGTLTVTLHAETDNAVVEIRDTGDGIAPQHLARIFDPFFTTKGNRGGTGLGLCVSQGIIKEHGGEIKVESEIGHGTLFRIWLPLTASEGEN